MFTKLNFSGISTLDCHYFPICSEASFGPISLGIVPCNNDGIIQEVYLSTCLLQACLSCLLLILSLPFAAQMSCLGKTCTRNGVRKPFRPMQMSP